MAWNVLRDGSFCDKNDAIVHGLRYMRGFLFFVLFALSAFLYASTATIHGPITIGHVTSILDYVESVVDGEKR
ncbi:uncharacterized protein P174DRAFT_442288 [Aspergillus novofumigatus IBT 16806]|uniref:Uncharacterized protein n=1 Tax=Aspergillus novofumigatus (strain IBT 16806) TaxID=1392255 RepID=A0A2I1C4C0_ASPN1|nr:uncharacterized protein P174DRAFT_442288 [Aspergillus novofumigatus IBT 16806]PKX92453.1 hypothetical protein P174DRAFT_442288 [Aspergillus novofumigatus IBT 16806]